VKHAYLIGVDEAGRGPIAGPVSVGAVMVRKDFDFSFFRGIKDSKQLTEHAREEWYGKLREARRAGAVRYSVMFSSHRAIDKKGIVPAVSSALERALAELHPQPRHCHVLLDGGLRAPSIFTSQETIIRGDAKEPLIAAASIVAKVSRDRLMKRLARRFPGYGFEVHKGYGTARHHTAIREYGFCDIHRMSFCAIALGKR
jgi:ribonuclease HII